MFHILQIRFEMKIILRYPQSVITRVFRSVVLIKMAVFPEVTMALHLELENTAIQASCTHKTLKDSRVQQPSQKAKIGNEECRSRLLIMYLPRSAANRPPPASEDEPKHTLQRIPEDH